MAINGKWQLRIKTPMGVEMPVLELKQDGDSIRGHMSGKDGEADIENPAVDGRTVTWQNDVQKPLPATLKFTAHIAEDNSLTGKVVLGPFGNADMTGEPI